MVSSVPAPSLCTEPPSRTSGALRTSSPSRSAISAPTAASRSYGVNFSPQALKRKCTATRRLGLVAHVDRSAVAQPRVVQRKLDDLDAAEPQAARAAAASGPGLAIIVTGSNAAIAFATAA